MLKTFKIGGVHPPENKLSAGEKIQILPVPEQVIIPLSQHIGAPATPIVKKGDTVKTGQLIASASGFVSANIHSSVSGTVIAIDNVTDAAGLSKPAITIKTEGDEWEEGINRDSKPADAGNLSKEEIIKAIAAAGIVGMGGATFPTQVKLTPPPGNKAEYLIINGVECEPYLTADHRVMLEKGKEILTGAQLLMKAIEVNKAIIGIENNKKDAIAHLQQLASQVPGVEICPLQVKYPQGGEKQLIQAITGRAVPSGALPIAVGAIVQNIGTVLAVYEAVVKHKPLIERVVTEWLDKTIFLAGNRGKISLKILLLSPDAIPHFKEHICEIPDSFPSDFHCIILPVSEAYLIIGILIRKIESTCIAEIAVNIENLPVVAEIETWIDMKLDRIECNSFYAFAAQRGIIMGWYGINRPHIIVNHTDIHPF